jgi:tRNA A-37 threonylcarbamoyl transferase component Bud32
MFSHFLRKVLPFGWRVTTTRPRTVRLGRRVWQLTPDADAVLGPTGPDLDRWLSDSRAEVVKTGPQRTVYRVRLDAGTVFVKHCRINGPRAFFREVLRPAKARLEFENALALKERGIPAAVPLAWGGPASGLPGESILITRCLEGVPFLRFVDQVLPALPADDQAAVRRQLAVGLGQFLAKLHDAGVAHPDPHAGNFVVELPPSRVPHFALLDLHAVRIINRPLGGNEVITNLVLYNRWFQMRASRTDRLRFWQSYRRSRPALSWLEERHLASRLEGWTLDSNLSFWAGREHRCLDTNRYFRRVRRGPFRGFAVRDLPEGVVQDVLADPDAVFTRPGVKLLKDSCTSTVAELVIPTADGPRAVVLKRINVRRGTELVKNLFRRSPAVRSWVNGHSLRDRWLPTPRPLLVFHRYRFGLPAEGYLLVERVPDSLELPAAIARHAHSPAVIRAWIHRLARALRGMHDRAVSHRDLKAANILISGISDPAAAAPVLIDLVGVRTRTRLTIQQRARELARLAASFLTSPIVSNGDRYRFLRSYLAAGPALGVGWKNWWALVSRAAAEKAARNRRTGRPLA